MCGAMTKTKMKNGARTLSLLDRGGRLSQNNWTRNSLLQCWYGSAQNSTAHLLDATFLSKNPKRCILKLFPIKTNGILPGASEKNDHPQDQAATKEKTRTPNFNVGSAALRSLNGNGRFYRDGGTPPPINTSTLKFGGGVAKLTFYRADGRFFRSHRNYSAS